VIRLELLARLRRTSRNGRLALLAFGSVAVLLDAGAKYSGWRASTLAADGGAMQRDDASWRESATSYAPYRFRLAGLPLDGMRVRCGDEAPPEAASQSSDGSFDINCTADTSVKAVREFPHAELLSWPNDSRYDRGVRF